MPQLLFTYQKRRRREEKSCRREQKHRRRMPVHSFGSDITNGIYGHRTVEERKEQIEKICIQNRVQDRPQDRS